MVTAAVSIHLMLLFIPLHRLRGKSVQIRFNTSHVTLYQTRPGGYYAETYVSIHLMLLFIAKIYDRDFSDARFNTSHVTLYPVMGLTLFAEYMFQYISCYSLSKYAFIKPSFAIAFQYISCYSLSVLSTLRCRDILRFQYISCYSLSKKQEKSLAYLLSFNTSHVTLYL